MITRTGTILIEPDKITITGWHANGETDGKGIETSELGEYAFARLNGMTDKEAK